MGTSTRTSTPIITVLPTILAANVAGAVNKPLDLKQIEQLEAYLNKRAKERGTDIETEERVLRASIEVGVRVEFDRYPIGLNSGIIGISKYLGVTFGDKSPDNFIRDESEIRILKLHRQMRDRMTIGPLLEKPDAFKFSDKTVQSEYQQALAGLRTAFISLKDSKSEQEWSTRFDITETAVDGKSPIVKISGKAEGVSFVREYIPDEHGKYTGFGSMRVTRPGADGKILTQNFVIDQSLNVSLTASGDPTNNASIAFKMPDSLLKK